MRNNWLDATELTIRQAALLILGIDPTVYEERCKEDAGYADLFGWHPIGGELSNLMVSLREAAFHSEIARVDTTNSDSFDSISILRSSLIEWLAKRNDQVGTRRLTCATLPEPPIPTFRRDDILSERGCRRLILENWEKVVTLHGTKADGRQVQRVINTHLDADQKMPTLKTVQNCLIKLRKEMLIP